MVEKVGSRPSSGGWMSGNNRRNGGIGLGEAFQRTDGEGNFIPRSSQRPTAGSAYSESRIPRTKTFSPAQLNSSPPTGPIDNYEVIGREGRSMSMPLDSESDETGSRVASPSPAARDRRWTRGESESDASPPSAVEEPIMDDVQRKIARSARMEERRKRILASTKPLFAKRDVGPKVYETVKTLERKTSESSLDDPDPPYNIPKSWGSKARKNEGWIQKILSPDLSLELKDPVMDQASSEPQHATADMPLPSVEGMSSLQNPTPPASRPTSAQPLDGSPEKSKMWNADLDFTAQSLQLSTSPLLRVKSAKLDDIRSREVENLSSRDAARNRLQEIIERSSEERSLTTDFARSNSKDRDAKGGTPSKPAAEETFHETTIIEEEGRPIPGTPITVFSAAEYEVYKRRRSKSNTPDMNTNNSEFGHKREDSYDLLRKLAKVLSPSPASTRFEDKADEGSKKDVSPKGAEQRNEEKSSNSGKVIGKSEENKVEEAVEKAAGDAIEKSTDKGTSRSNTLDIDVTKRHSRTSTPPKSDVDPEERITAEARLFELQDNKSERNSVRFPSRSPSPSENGKFDETPRQKPDPMSLPTPRVTGAFIETPATTTRKLRKARSFTPYYEVVNAADETVSSSQRPVTESTESIQNPKQLRRTSSQRQLIQLQPEATVRQSRPPLINTAKRTTAAEDLRELELKARLESSLLDDDFDALLEAEAAKTADSEHNSTILDSVLDLEFDERGRPLSQKEIERRIERLTLERMSQSIKNTSTSIRDARHGIERLEQQVSSAVPAVSFAEIIERHEQQIKQLQQQLSDRQNQGQSSSALPFISVANPDRKTSFDMNIRLPKLWISQPPLQPDMRPGWKFTWLGLILAIFCFWLISETLMCAQFCKPGPAAWKTWHHKGEYFPWTIPTKLDYWTGQVVGTALDELRIALGGERKEYWQRQLEGSLNYHKLRMYN